MPEPHPEIAGPELNTGPGGVGLTEPHAEPRATLPKLRLYVAILLLAPFLFLAACFALVRSDLFQHHDPNVYLATIGYATKLHNSDCQVLIYGDSSALVGVDPATIQRLTGLSACNIAEFAGMTMVNGTFLVDDYLKHNQRPRYLVFLFAPENLAPYPKWQYVSSFEAIFFRIHQGFDRGLFHLLVFHGEDVLSTAESASRYALTWPAYKPLTSSQLHDRETNRGRLSVPGKTLTECEAVGRLHPPSRAWTNDLRARYGIDGTHVLVDVTPVPTCDPALPIYRTELTPGIVDNQLHTYPIDFYNQTGRLHMTPPGINAISAEIAAQIKQQETR